MADISGSIKEAFHPVRFGESLRIAAEHLDCRNFYAFNPNYDRKTAVHPGPEPIKPPKPKPPAHPGPEPIMPPIICPPVPEPIKPPRVPYAEAVASPSPTPGYDSMWPPRRK